MSTTKACRARLHELIQEWFAAPDPAYAVPIAATNIIGYFTTPKERSASPNWIIVHTIHTSSQSFTLGGAEQPALFGILLASRLSKGDDAELSRELAEAWLDDAEEMLLTLLTETDEELWNDIIISSAPQRDADPILRGLFRSSHLLIEMEK